MKRLVTRQKGTKNQCQVRDMKWTEIQVRQQAFIKYTR